jgi:4-amino-4-deoxy-L-arabinose transferase-like glycosyltransferase
MDKLMALIKRESLLFILLGMAAVLIFVYSWVPGGLDVDSCNYGAVAKEILRTNKWLGLYDPVYQGVFYYHFPLCIWITAFFFKLFGVSSFSAALFSMLSSFTLVAAIFYFGKILKNSWVGFLGGVGFLLTNHIVRLSRQCRMDLPLSLFITLAILSFVLSQRRSRFYYLAFGLFTSLAIFAKDISGLMPLVIVFIYLIILRRWKEFLHPLFIAGIVISLGPVWGWIWIDHKTLFLPWLNWNFLHLLNSPAFKVPWYYYIWAIATKYFYFLPFAVYGGYLAVKEAHNSKKYEFYLLIIWALVFPFAFSFGRQKLHYFILPMYPAASLLLGMAFDKIFKEQVKIRIARTIKYILVVSIIFMFCVPLHIKNKRFEETVHMAPEIDRVLRQLPGYEFLVYRQDVAAILFYSQELSRVKYVQDKKTLGDSLGAPCRIPRLCFIKQQDFGALDTSIRAKFRTILQYKDMMLFMACDNEKADNS